MDINNILFIGAGNMGQSIIDGIIKTKLIHHEKISIYEPDDKVADSVVSKYKVKRISDIKTGIKNFFMIVVAVKPQIFKGFDENPEMSILKSEIGKDCVVVSIMAGINIETLKRFFKSTNSIVRVMPNTPALIGKGVSALCSTKETGKDPFDAVVALFDSIGESVVVDEKYFDAVTGLSGSGPAYVLMFIEALTQGGILSGLPKNVAEKLAIATVAGTSMMAQVSDKSVEDLRHMVTSPGGTTISGVAELENRGLRSAVMNAVYKASERSKELGK